ncbi:outer membrane protein assembly factor BamB family protein [Jejuia pallidilutea]|uniref:Predicted cell surface protein/ lipoprotein n=3 Tax=Jejuia pallidilutea TaxID=504487 RepID=A0A090VTE9_9FLAO|nr:PQQ-binding-like beta-propeller repeat protein [Jejuia pallidilutea]GAL67990.1 predicted cell surface protein/ lipoprotein [Jejuia pallidilutea]
MKIIQNKKRYIIALCFVIGLSFPNLNSQTNMSSGLSDIDEIRKEIKKNPTNETNYKSRKSAFYRWWRLFWRQGYDLRDLDSISQQLITNKPNPKENYLVVDEAYSQLEGLLKSGKKIQEKKGKEAQGSTSKTNWPFYFGTEESQIGHSPDQGPTKGEIAWKFPKGYYSYAHPVIENGKVYLSSPGIDVNGFCLNEESGEVIWRCRQMGTNFYIDPGSRWSPIVTDSTVIVRNDFSQETIHIYNKKTGIELKKDVNVPVELFYYTRDGKQLVGANIHTGQDVWVKLFDNYITKQPVWNNGKVFVALRNGNVVCLNEKSKEVLWDINLYADLVGTPSIVKDLLMIGDKNGKLHALNINTGELKFVFSNKNNNPRANQSYSGVIQHKNRMYFGSAASELYCLNFEGELMWTLPLSDWVRATPTIVNNDIFVATFDATLYTVKDLGKKAKIKRKTKLGEHPVTADLVSSNSSILVADQGLILHAVSPDTGKVKWQHGIVDGVIENSNYYMADWSGGLLGTPTIVDGIAYIGGPDGFVNAVDVNTGKEKWRFETNSTVSLAPTVIEDKVFFGYLGSSTEHYGYENPGEYFAVNKDTGKPVWTSKEFARVWVSATYNDGIMFFGNTDGFVFAVNPDNGNILWTYNTAKDTPKEHIPLTKPFTHGFPSGVYSIPVKDDKNFYVGSWSGYYFAFDQKTGKMLWRTNTSAHDYGGLPDSAALMLHEGILYVQQKGGWIAAINTENGNIEWQWKGKRGYLQNATVAAGEDRFFGSVVLKVIELPYSSEIMAFDKIENGGKILWKQDDIGGLTPAVTSKNQLISGSSTSMFLTGLNPKNGEILWRVFTGGEMLENAPAIYGNKVLALCKNGYLFAIE